MTLKESLSNIAEKIVTSSTTKIDFIMSVGFYAFIVAVIVSSWFNNMALLQSFVGPVLVFTLYQGMKLGIKEGRKYLHDEVVKAALEIVDKMKNGNQP